jgi:outer membrane protein
MNSKLLAAAALAALSATQPAHAAAGDWLVRLRAIDVAPTEKSGPVQPSFPAGRVAVDDAIVPEIDFTYMLTDNVGAELILATSPHDIDGRGSLAAVGKLADTMALPPTLTLQYHFAPEAKVRPYVGAGLNYTIFYDEDASSALETAIGQTRVSADDSFGYALQAGFDVDLTERVFLNVDVKYIDIDTTATLRTGALTNRVDVSLDPVVVGVGLGMRF